LGPELEGVGLGSEAKEPKEQPKAVLKKNLKIALKTTLGQSVLSETTISQKMERD
jgi:hypothetical protein